ncbi:hypothetical protein [Aliamphritea ceti]|uniref:hypothetical protein n=1 Tax=Aliamphritea ceti TaxID=1524258 RepID=UPI0021C47243|nr:hypothetical protein [Aliamphritea ceti]
MDISQLPSSNLFSNPLSSDRTPGRNERLDPPGQTQSDEVSRRGSSQAVAASERFTAAESFSLTLETKEGDKVTIEFSGQDSFRASIAGVSNNNGQAASVSLEQSSSSSFGFSVEGDLNADELDAITNLVKDMTGIANDFFSGNVQDAFNTAANYQMDGAELASMDFQLTRSQTYTSTAMYENVQQMNDPGFGLQGLQPIREGLTEQLGNAHQIMQDATDFTRSLLNNLIEQDGRYTEASNNAQQQLQNNLSMLDSMLANLGTQSGDETQLQEEPTGEA